MIQKLNSIFTENKRKVFLLDSAGALLSFLLLYFVLKPNSNIVGLPEDKINILAYAALFFCVFSFLCYNIVNIKRNGLLLVVLMNSLYALFTLVLLFIYQSEIKTLGWLYFIIELVVLVIIIQIEIKVMTSWK